MGMRKGKGGKYMVIKDYLTLGREHAMNMWVMYGRNVHLKPM